MALGLTQPPIQWVPGALSLEVKWPVCEADHSPPSSAEVKNEWRYTSTSPIHLNHRDNFNFYLLHYVYFIALIIRNKVSNLPFYQFFPSQKENLSSE
jgi:hypothetical protein